MELRSFATELELRSASKRILCGILVPYGVDQWIDDELTERFEPGVCAHQFRSAHRIMLSHQHSNVPGFTPLGRAVELRDEPGGLYGELRIAPSMLGDHFLSLAKEGDLKQWSVGFIPERDVQDGNVTVRMKATVKEVALVQEGAYGELASVGAVRSATPLPKLHRDALMARLPKSYFPR